MYKEYKCKQSIDVVKFLMAIIVIAIHTRPFFSCTNDRFLTLYNNITSMAVPFFFLASGYLMAMRISFSQEEDVGIIRKQLNKIIRMYLTWMLIYTPLSVYHSVVTKQSFIKELLRYIRGLVLVGENYNSWPLWYLLSTIYALVVIIILIKKNITSKGLLAVSTIAMIVSVSINWLVAFDSNDSIIVTMIQKVLIHTIGNGRIFSGLIYIPIGMYLFHKPISKVKNAILLIISFILNYIISNGVISEILVISSSIAFFGLIEKLQLSDRPIYAQLRNMSTVLYLIHMYVWSIYYKIRYGTRRYGMDCFLATVVVSCIIAVVYLKVRHEIKQNMVDV